MFMCLVLGFCPKGCCVFGLVGSCINYKPQNTIKRGEKSVCSLLHVLVLFFAVLCETYTIALYHTLVNCSCLSRCQAAEGQHLIQFYGQVEVQRALVCMHQRELPQHQKLQLRVHSQTYALLKSNTPRLRCHQLSCLLLLTRCQASVHQMLWRAGASVMRLNTCLVFFFCCVCFDSSLEAAIANCHRACRIPAKLLQRS